MVIRSLPVIGYYQKKIWLPHILLLHKISCTVSFFGKTNTFDPKNCVKIQHYITVNLLTIEPNNVLSLINHCFKYLGGKVENCHNQYL